MSLTAWYKLNGDLLDSSGNGNHGLGTSGNPIFVDGIVGKCLSFDGVDDCLNLPRNPKLNTDRWTISMWVNTSSQTTGKHLLTPQSDGNDMYITVDYYLGLFLTEAGDLNNRSYSAKGLDYDNWNHIAITLEDTVISFYINGVVRGRSIDTGKKAKWIAPLKVGDRGTGTSKYYKGLVSDIRIYDHCLSDKEIYNLSKAKVLHYDFDDVEEPTVNLLPNPITLSGYIGGGSAITTQIKVGSGLNGSNSYMATRGAGADTGDWQMIPPSFQGVLAGETLTMSLLYKTSSPGFQFLLGDLDTVNGVRPGWDIIEDKPFNSEWRIRVARRTFPKASNFAIIGLNSIGLNGWVEICLPQVEKKDHATPFVNGTRDNILVRDKSDYGNDSLPLTVATTPAFVEDCKIGRQGADFSKAFGKTIVIDNFVKPKSFTVCTWAKINAGVFAEQPGRVGHNIYTNNDGFCFSSELTCWVKNSDGRQFLPFNGAQYGVWGHYCFTYDETTGILNTYLNGNLCGTRALTNKIVVYGGSINSISISLSSYPTNGLMDDLRIYATALTAEDIKEIYQSRANLDNKGNLKVGELVSYKNKQRLFDYSDWKSVGVVAAVLGATPKNGIVLNQSNDSENNFIYDLDPFGKPIIVWQGGNDSNSDVDGGWESSVPINSSKKYRFSVWAKRSVAGNGRFFMGCSVVESVAGVTQSNPYWHIVNARSANGEMQSEWQLFVYYIFPKDYTGAEEPTQGVYKVGKGKVHEGSIGRNCASPLRWNPGATAVNFRTYLYYSTDPSTRQEWCYPRIDLCDGTEPTIDELLNGYDSRNYDLYMQKGNVKNVFDVSEKGILTTNNISELGVTEGLIAHYPLNGDARDYSGNGNDGTVVGATVAAGLGQKCYSFDGGSSFVYSELQSPSNSLTVHLWFKQNSTPKELEMLCGQGNTGSLGYWLGIGQSRLTFSVGASGEHISIVQTKTDSISNLTNWNCFSVTFDSSNGLKIIYLNGVEIKRATTLARSIVYGGLTDTAKKFKIGARDTIENYRFFNGGIQDVRIYNRALTPEEVLINYNLTKADKTAMIQAENGTTYVNKIKEV